jgi:beta-galactosidase/beta-glucuronidase
MDEIIHPRPQLARATWTDLCGTWGFAYDDEDTGLEDRWHLACEPFLETILVPFPPESPASGLGRRDFHPVVWYRRTFSVVAGPDERVILHFGAVDYRARVWVNGLLVADHEGGHTPFRADVTGQLHAGADEQVIVVRAEDRPADLEQPRGKQDWELEPHKIWYHRTTGIWQPVWLEIVGRTHVADLRWTPDLDRNVLGLQMRLNEPPRRPLTLSVELSLHGAPVASDRYLMEQSEIRRDIALGPETTMTRERVHWSPRTPNLIDAVLTLRDGDRVVDEVRSYAGMRSAAFVDGRFLLNDRPYYLRLALAQNYWPESHLAAPHAGALRREVELAKELGFNGVRIHQKVEDPRFLYWCDRLGLLVWGEMANAYVFSPLAVERLTREWIDVVARDYSHPCIVTWVPFNESWGVLGLERDPAQQSYVRAIYHLTKALDPTRPVVGNDGWEHLVGDVWGIHDYASEGSVIRERYGRPEAVETTLETLQPHFRTLVLPQADRRGQPVMLTECGGMVLIPRTRRAWRGYSVVEDEDALVARYEELITAILGCRTIAGFCYTQLTDTEQETNGLLWADRTPKVDPETIRAITTRPSAAVPGDLLAAVQIAAETI